MIFNSWLLFWQILPKSDLKILRLKWTISRHTEQNDRRGFRVRGRLCWQCSVFFQLLFLVNRWNIDVPTFLKTKLSQNKAGKVAFFFKDDDEDYSRDFQCKSWTDWAHLDDRPNWQERSSKIFRKVIVLLSWFRKLRNRNLIRPPQIIVGWFAFFFDRDPKFI